MKKKKLSFLLNIATICLAIIAIAIGVYSAKQASLNIGGSLGFTAHNCNVLITPYVTGYNGVDESSTKQEKVKQTAVELGGTDGKSSKDLTLTSLNFNDLKDDGDTIVIDLEIENKSAFDVQVTIGMPTLKRSDNTTEIEESIVTKVVTNGSNTLTSANNKVTLKDKTSTTEKTTTITITLTVVDINSTLEDILNNAKISMSLSFGKVAPAKDSYLASNWKELIFTSYNGNSNGFCLCENISKLIFTDSIPAGCETKTIAVGSDALDEARTLGSALTNSEVEDVIAYGKKDSSNKYEIYLYSLGKIYISNKGGCVMYDISDSYWEIFKGYQFSNLGMSIIEWGNADLTKVTDMSSMFLDCSGLTSLDVTKFDTSNVTDMSSMFLDCSGLTSLDVTKFDTSKVTNMQEMFSVCSGLTSLDLSNFDTSSVISMSYMFNNCRGLTSLDLTNFNTSKVTNMGSMFYSCTKLETIYVGSSWSIASLSTSSINREGAFSGCTSLNKNSTVAMKYDSSKVTADYAITGTKGYLTLK